MRRKRSREDQETIDKLVAANLRLTDDLEAMVKESSRLKDEVKEAQEHIAESDEVIRQLRADLKTKELRLQARGDRKGW